MYTPPSLYPATTAPDDVPAFVGEVPEDRTVRIWHPSKDARHENVQLAAERYQWRGWTVQHVIEQKELVVVGSRRAELSLPRAA